MKITYLAHSCFVVEEDGWRVVFDPYEPGSVPGAGDVNEEANMVICSHEHGDHNARGCVKIVGEGVPCPFEIRQIQTYHDECNGAKRGKNTITLLKGRTSLVHMGDIGCPLTEEQIGELKGADVLLIPVGGFFTIDAAQAKAMADAIGARVVIPMHYRGEGFGYDVIGPVEAFTKLCDTVKEYGDTIEVDENTEPQTAVLARRLGI